MSVFVLVCGFVVCVVSCVYESGICLGICRNLLLVIRRQGLMVIRDRGCALRVVENDGERRGGTTPQQQKRRGSGAGRRRA